MGDPLIGRLVPQYIDGSRAGFGQGKLEQRMAVNANSQLSVVGMPTPMRVLSYPKFRRLTLSVRGAGNCRADFIGVIKKRIAAFDHLFKRKSRVGPGQRGLMWAHSQIAGRIDRTALE
jgi:hypothetical protein